MRRKLCCIAGVIALALALSGCDSCGDLAKFNAPSVPKSCQGEPHSG